MIPGKIMVLARLIPEPLRWLLRNFKILAMDFGQWRSITERLPVDKGGNPIPWYAHPVIEYLKQRDLVDKNVGNKERFGEGAGIFQKVSFKGSLSLHLVDGCRAYPDLADTI